MQRFYTPADQTIDADTLYSCIGMDVRDGSSTACLLRLYVAAALVRQDLEARRVRAGE